MPNSMVHNWISFRQSRGPEELIAYNGWESFWQDDWWQVDWWPRPQVAQALSSNLVTKTKNGLQGFINGKEKAAMADTGSKANIISLAYAKKLGLRFWSERKVFRLGNSRKTKSKATVRLHWAFAEDPLKTFRIVCHVLDNCTYDMILGSDFLSITETMSRFKHRITRCSFKVASRMPRFGFLGGSRQRLYGKLAGKYNVHAIPDSGADRNVMDLQYAISNNFEITRRPGGQGYLQFADGTCGEIYGQVKTQWAFLSGKKISLTFEVLENCCSDVVLGEKVLLTHDVFTVHATSLCVINKRADVHELAPFDYVRSWQRICGKVLGKLKGKGRKRNQNDDDTAETEAETFEHEARRRDLWNFEHDFGKTASSEEQEQEEARRRDHEARIRSRSRRLEQQQQNRTWLHRGLRRPLLPEMDPALRPR